MAPQTIAALSSPPGTSGLAVVRLSGPGAREVVKACLRNPDPESHRMTFAKFRHPSSGESLDQLNYVWMKAPRTSTGEDVLELYPHGNPYLIEKMLEFLLVLPDVRLAEPGEFTRRALENGKLDLLQAEAVGELLHATNTASLRNAQQTLEGKLSRPLASLKEKLKNISIKLELDVDFAESEEDPDYASWEKELAGLSRQVSGMMTGWKTGQQLKREPRIALFGKPNAGKSSLINALLQQERLLVSEIPGTTRDYVEVPVHLPSGRALLVDTAGLGAAVDAMDARAMKMTRDVLEATDVKVQVVDGCGGEESPADVTCNLTVATKRDLPGFKTPPGAIAVSNLTGEGLQEFLESLDRKCWENLPLADGDTFLATRRQYACLEEANRCLENALSQFSGEPAVEILAFEVRQAHRALAELIGEFRTEDLLNQLFASFCIGK